jgi:hypothetical protein
MDRMLRTPIVRVLFERGRFSAMDTAATAEALLWFAVGLAGIAGARIAAQVFYALREPAVAVRCGVLAVAVNIVAALILMRPFGHAGLAAAASFAAYVNLAGLVWAARGRLARSAAPRFWEHRSHLCRLDSAGRAVRRRAVALAFPGRALPSISAGSCPPSPWVRWPRRGRVVLGAPGSVRHAYLAATGRG